MSEVIELRKLNTLTERTTAIQRFEEDREDNESAGSRKEEDDTPSERSLAQEDEENQGHEEAVTQYALPPADCGARAWLFLAGATMMELLIWAIPTSVGVLHVYWTNELFEGSGTATLTLAATLHSGLVYMSTALLGPLVVRATTWQKTIQVVTWIISAAGLIASAFATQPWHLIVTFGIIYPVCGAAYLPCATLLFEWFVKARGTAMGIVYAGMGVGGAVCPFIIDGLLKRYSYKTTMISIGVGFGIIGLISLIPIRHRIPPTSRSHHSGKRWHAADWSFMKSTALMAGLATILLTSLGNFVPSLWLPSFADDLSLTRPSGTGLVAILNAASVPGNAILGIMSDHMSLRVVILISCIGSGLACAFLWGFGTNDGMLVAFTIIFGLLGPSFSALWTKMNAVISKDNPFAITIVLSLFTFIRGVGNLTSGPISEALLKYNTFKGGAGAYGVNNYGVLLLYSSITILSGGVTGAMLKEKST
ncbi:monocarboxylic acid transporter [Cryptococcus neoformans Ze90-1]|nr:monocarboxylic acid transporter [Cryptococcus neoformans var. grubii Ze90-1]